MNELGRHPDRRGFLRLSAAALAAAACTPTAATVMSDTPLPSQGPAEMPAVFVSHGAPTMALDRASGADFARLSAALPRPRAILVVSAHWLDAPATIGTRIRRELMYDFAGFPDELYRVRYAAPAAGELAAQLAAAMPSLLHADERAWDHGVWAPLLHMYPDADVSVLQLSVPYRWQPRQLFELGRQLAPLRKQGVLLLGSGGMVHNLARLDWSGGNRPAAWATSFEGWVRERLQVSDFDGLVAYREKAPDLQLAHPNDDHFLPLLIAAGAAADDNQCTTFPIEGFELGSLSRLAVRFG